MYQHYSWNFPPVIPLRSPDSPTVFISQRELKLPTATPPAEPANGRAGIWDSICLAQKSDSFHYITLPPIGSINPYKTLKGRYCPTLERQEVRPKVFIRLACSWSVADWEKQ